MQQTGLCCAVVVTVTLHQISPLHALHQLVLCFGHGLGRFFDHVGIRVHVYDRVVKVEQQQPRMRHFLEIYYEAKMNFYFKCGLDTNSTQHRLTKYKINVLYLG